MVKKILIMNIVLVLTSIEASQPFQPVRRQREIDLRFQNKDLVPPRNDAAESALYPRPQNNNEYYRNFYANAESRRAQLEEYVQMLQAQKNMQFRLYKDSSISKTTVALQLSTYEGISPIVQDGMISPNAKEPYVDGSKC